MRAFLHATKVFIGAEQPITQVTDLELKCLLKYVQETGVVVEIGCYEGSTTAAIAKNTKGRVYSIDPFFPGRLGFCYGEWVAKFTRRRQKLRNIEFLKGYSYDIAANFHESVDLLFVDANHTFDAVKRDWEDWFPKVRNHGIIAMHDCRQAPNSPTYLGSMKFYDEYLPCVAEVKEIDGVDSLAVLRVVK